MSMQVLFPFFFKIYLFIYFYFWLRWVFVAACGLSLVAVSRGYSSLQCAGFSLRWLLLLQSTGSRLAGSRAQAQYLGRTSLVAPRHVGSSRTRSRTRVPCISRRILNHCTTREAHFSRFLIRLFVLLLSYRSSLYNLDINPLSDIQFANIFSHSEGYLFTLLIVSFDAQTFLILMKFNLSMFFFCCLWF